MKDVPKLLLVVAILLIVALAAVAVAGSAPGGHIVAGAVLGVAFVGVFLGGMVYGTRTQPDRAKAQVRRDLAVARAWVGALTAIWIGLYFVSTTAMWLAFPLVLMQVAVLGVGWGAGAALLVAVVASGVSVWRAAPDAPSPAALISPVLGSATAVLLMWAVLMVSDQSRGRKETLRELQRTHGLLAAAEEQAVLAKERQRLAGEIHDTLSQGLSATAMLLRSAERVHPHDPQKALDLVSQALGATEQNQQQARHITTTLAPIELATSRLPAALRLLAEEPREGGIPLADLAQVNVIVEDDPALSALTLAEEAALLRVAQSALWNAREHSGASEIRICLTVEGGQVRLQVSDNGRGFPGVPTPAAGRGLGIPSMKTRMKAAGGRLHLDNAGDSAGDRAGTTVTATLPTRTAKGMASDE